MTIKIQKVYEGDIHVGKLEYPADGYIFEVQTSTHFPNVVETAEIYIRLSDLADFQESDADIVEVDSWREE